MAAPLSSTRSHNGVLLSTRKTEEELVMLTSRTSQTVLNKAFSDKETNKPITFNGDAKDHPMYMVKLQEAMRHYLGVYAPSELGWGYHFRAAPKVIQDRLYPQVVRTLVGTAKTWAQMAMQTEYVDEHGQQIVFPTLFAQLIQYLDLRFDPTNANNQALNALYDAVVGFKYTDGERNKPWNNRIEEWFATFFTLLRDYAEFKSISVTEAFKEQHVQNHVSEQLPFFLAKCISDFGNPTDVEATVTSVCHKLSIDYNFAKAKKFPLTTKEHLGSGTGNEHEPSKQYAANRRAKKNKKPREYLNIDLGKCPHFGEDGVCWKCGMPGHDMRPGECAEADALSEENNRKGLDFKEANRAAVKEWQKVRDSNRRANDRGHGAAEMCRRCGDPRHTGPCESERETREFQSAMLSAFTRLEESMQTRAREDDHGGVHAANGAARRPASRHPATRRTASRNSTTSYAAFAEEDEDSAGPSE